MSPQPKQLTAAAPTLATFVASFQQPYLGYQILASGTTTNGFNGLSLPFAYAALPATLAPNGIAAYTGISTIPAIFYRVN